MTKNELTIAEYAPYYELYLKNVANDTELIKGLEQSMLSTSLFFEKLPEEKLLYAYAEGKWTPLEVLQHITDTERVFTYRALRFSRNDVTALPGFDHNAYVPTSDANSKTLVQLLTEFTTLRAATISLYQGFSSEALTRLGVASNAPISVRAIPFILIGHELHHIRVVKERY